MSDNASFNMQRWPDRPNNWPTGQRFTRLLPGFFNRLRLRRETGVVGRYVYSSGSTYVPVHWQTSGETEMVHVSEIYKLEEESK